MINSEELRYLLETTLIQALVYTCLALIVLTVAFSFYSRLKRLEYDQHERRIKLDALRSSKESKIYDLVGEMTASDERWKQVNHLLLDSSEPLSKVENRIINLSSKSPIKTEDFLNRLGIKANELDLANDKVFYLTPFHEEFDDTYRTVRRVVTDLGLKFSRGDEEFTSGPITRHIFKEILEAKFIIANLDGRNPNVFYELGFANAIGKPVIMLANHKTSTPFDVSVDRTLFWTFQEQLRNDLMLVLAKLAISESAPTAS